MDINDPVVRKFVRQSMVARVATLSRSGRPSITPLYFVYANGHVWLGTSDWTLAAREAKADPRVSVLFEIERNPDVRRILRITGSATVRTDAKTWRPYVLRTAFKYVLTPGSIRNQLANLDLIQANRRYHAQSAEKGLGCVIDVTVAHVEFLNKAQHG